MTAFPFAETGLRVRLDLDGSGAFATDITSYCHTPSGGPTVDIQRALQSEGSTAPPSQMKLTLLNPDRRFSPRNANGQWFGQIGRNTAIRADVPHIATRLVVPIGVGPGLSTPDTAPLSITGDIDLRIDLEMPAWQAAGTSVLHKWVEAGNQRSFAIYITSTGMLRFYWSTTGSDTNYVDSWQPIPRGPKRQTLRITVDVDNGSGGATFRFYTGTSKDASVWTTVGAGVAIGFTTSFYNSTAPVGVADTAAGAKTVPMKVFGAQVRNGIAGTVVSDLDLTAIAEGATTVADAQGNVWTPTSGAQLQTRDIRFQGVVPSWSPTAGRVSDDSRVEVTAVDDTKRLGKTGSSLASVYRRACVGSVASVTSLIGYWPMEDAAGATMLGSGLSGGPVMNIFGSPSLASEGTSFLCSDPLPTFSSDFYATAAIPQTTDGAVQLRMLLKIPAAGVTANTRVLSLYTSGTAARWDLTVSTLGEFYLEAFDVYGGSIWNSGWSAFLLNGRANRIGLSLQQSGGNIAVTLSALTVGSATGAYISGTVTTRTVGHGSRVVIAPDRGLGGCVGGQLTVQSAVTSIWELYTQLTAYVGEDAPTRITRLCTENGVAYSIVGAGGPLLGAQRSGRLIDLLREVESADAGILFTPRDGMGIAYRTSDGMSARDPVLTVSYGSGGIVDATPVEDDQQTANDVTGSRVNGSAYRIVDTTSTMSTQDPPAGVGLYDSAPSAWSLSADSGLPDRTSWALHEGTIDEPRIPGGMTFDLGSLAYVTGTAPATQQQQIRDLDVGDRILMTGIPEAYGTSNIDQVAIGLKEQIGPWVHRIAAVCRPASTYRVGIYDDTASRWSGDGTVTTSSMTTSSPSVNVLCPAGIAWGHADGDYSVTVGGEEMTVTAVATTALLPNPTFDAGITDWYAINGSLSWEQVVTHSGAGSVKMVTGAGVQPRIESGGSGLIPVTPGEILTVGGWIRVDTSRSASLNINWYDSNGTWFGGYVGGPVALTANTWTVIAYLIAVYPGTAYVNIGANEVGTPGAGLVMYLDDTLLTSDRRQTLTVTRSVNGVVKTHAAGEALDLTRPVYYGL